VAAVLAFGLAIVLPPRAHAATFACGAGNVACLINAIHEANANGETNTITLAAGTYTMTAIENGDEFEGNGLPVITSPLTITGAGAEVTSITRDANAPPFRILKVEATGTLTLQGLTLRGFTNGIAGAEGGGIANSGTLTLIDCTLTENSAALDGGGILNRGTLRLTRTTVTRNCGEEGGGIANIATPSTNATATITDSIIADNFCARGGGGGLFNNGEMSLTATTVTRNGADGGGGLYIAGGTVSITDSAITANTSSVQPGGGILITHGTLVMTNTTIAANVVEDGPGGGLVIGLANVVLINSTIAENMAGTKDVPEEGGGLLNSAGTVRLQNTLIARNHGESPDCAGDILSLGHNLIGDLTGCTITLLATDLTGDPGLGPFTDDGIPGHGHFPLLAGSPAIDAGNNAACPAADQRGQPRPVDGNGDGTATCDIGAIEFFPLVNDLVTFTPLPATFTTTADPAGCPAGFAGTFRFTARLTTKASSPTLTDLRVQVQTLTNGNLLQNADGGPGGVGATVTVPQADAFIDGLLSPEEVVDVPFVVCLQQHSPFRFLVNVLGIASAEGE
jgi:hypothetical protein